MKPSPATSRVRIRLSLCLLGLVMLLSQMDRFILSVLAQPIIAELRLSDSQFGLLTGLAFAFFYARTSRELPGLLLLKVRAVHCSRESLSRP